jgi:C4-dicarboxylate-specific signal transduction histidine kinase
VPLADVAEDSLRLNAAEFERHAVQIVRDYSAVPLVEVDRQKVLQILVNVVTNAKNALSGSDNDAKQNRAPNQKTPELSLHLCCR